MTDRQYGLVSYKGKRWYQGDGSPAPWLDVATGEKAPEEYYAELHRLSMLKNATKAGEAWPAWRARLERIISMLTGLGRRGRPPDQAKRACIRDAAKRHFKPDGSLNISKIARDCDCDRQTVKDVLGCTGD